MTRPPSIPHHYVETSPGTWSHPSLVGALPATKPERDHGQLSQGDSRAETVTPSVEPGRKFGRVTIIRVARRKLETHDNLRTSMKFLVDAIADSVLPGMPPGRADDHFDWENQQFVSAGQQGTIVKIEL